ncbi:hypothetical protein DN585_17475 [Intrasporangium calvum]|nr:hypothetical protein DN585_17475 [Intrasporangium calvum]
MKTIDLIAWSEALRVHPTFVSNALRQKIQRVETTSEELRVITGSLKDAPDDELVMCLRSASRSMEEALRVLESALREVGR